MMKSIVGIFTSQAVLAAAVATKTDGADSSPNVSSFGPPAPQTDAAVQHANKCANIRNKMYAQAIRDDYELKKNFPKKIFG